MSPRNFLNKLIDKYNFIAMNKDGEWYAFISRPYLDNIVEGLWYPWGENSFPVGPNSGICYEGHWKESLFQRDLIKEKLMGPQELLDHLAEHYKFIAMDKNKRWYAYDSVPMVSNRTQQWILSEEMGSYYCGEGGHRVTCFDGSWKDSLFEREDKEEK